MDLPLREAGPCPQFRPIEVNGDRAKNADDTESSQ